MDFNAQTITKMVATILSIVVFATYCMCHHLIIASTYERLLLCGIYAGFMILYIAIMIGIFAGKELDQEVCGVWSLYGFASHLGAGAIELIIFHHNNTDDEIYGLIGGILALALSVVFALDTYFSQK